MLKLFNINLIKKAVRYGIKSVYTKLYASDKIRSNKIN